VDHEPVEVQREDDPREGLADSPEDVRGYKGGERVLRVREGFGDNPPYRSCDDGRDDGEEERGCYAV
jgi:hypothetical protein